MKNFSSYVLSELEKGSQFSNILKANPYIVIEKKYRQLFASEEKTGSYKKSLAYVCKLEKEKREQIGEYFKLSLYPCFIIILCFFGSFFLAYFGVSLSSLDTKTNSFDGLLYANLFLFFFLLCFSLALYLTHRKTEKHVFLMCLEFFLNNAYDLTTSLEYASALFNENKTLREAIVQSIVDLELGLPIVQAFSNAALFSKQEIKKLEAYIHRGNICDGIKALLTQYEKKAQTIKEVFKSLLEPSLIFAAGTYLLIIIMQSILPLLLFYGGVL